MAAAVSYYYIIMNERGVDGPEPGWFKYGGTKNERKYR